MKIVTPKPACLLLLSSFLIVSGCSNSQPDAIKPELTEQQIQQIMDQEKKARSSPGTDQQPTGEASKSVPDLGLD